MQLVQRSIHVNELLIRLIHVVERSIHVYELSICTPYTLSSVLYRFVYELLIHLNHVVRRSIRVYELLIHLIKQLLQNALWRVPR